MTKEPQNSMPATKDQRSMNTGMKVLLSILLMTLLLSGAGLGIYFASSLHPRRPHGNAPVTAEATVGEPHCHFGMLGTFMWLTPPDTSTEAPHLPQIKLCRMYPCANSADAPLLLDDEINNLGLIAKAQNWKSGVTPICFLPNNYFPRQVLLFEAHTDQYNK